MKKFMVTLACLLMTMVSFSKEKGRAFVYYYDQKNGLYDYFIKSEKGDWEEINVVKNQVKCRFKTVSEAPEQTILYDEDRNIYLRLTTSKCFSGKDKTNTSNWLYDGYWLAMNEGPSANIMLDKGEDIFIYEKKECRGFFAKRGKEWLEYNYKHGLLLNTYSIVEEKDDHITLKCNREGYYIKLTNKCCLFASSLICKRKCLFFRHVKVLMDICAPLESCACSSMHLKDGSIENRPAVSYYSHYCL